MTHTEAGRTGTAVGFADARAAANRVEAVRRDQAARTVAGNAVDADDCRELLSMLGLAPAGEAGRELLVPPPWSASRVDGAPGARWSD
ncbi:hypothetical protein ACIGNX_17820 [Actinosynnema sp. NPDC053489]|uniref:hypothetical protein n=1 Tax=Actinosynnema sp. NPDC053489 TaxID=3363916 RepID=UPI0037C6430E